MTKKTTKSTKKAAPKKVSTPKKETTYLEIGAEDIQFYRAVNWIIHNEKFVRENAEDEMGINEEYIGGLKKYQDQISILARLPLQDWEEEVKKVSLYQLSKLTGVSYSHIYRKFSTEKEIIERHEGVGFVKTGDSSVFSFVVNYEQNNAYQRLEDYAFPEGLQFLYPLHVMEARDLAERCYMSKVLNKLRVKYHPRFYFGKNFVHYEALFLRQTHDEERFARAIHFYLGVGTPFRPSRFNSYLQQNEWLADLKLNASDLSAYERGDKKLRLVEKSKIIEKLKKNYDHYKGKGMSDEAVESQYGEMSENYILTEMCMLEDYGFTGTPGLIPDVSDLPIVPEFSEQTPTLEFSDSREKKFWIGYCQRMKKEGNPISMRQYIASQDRKNFEKMLEDEDRARKEGVLNFDIAGHELVLNLKLMDLQDHEQEIVEAFKKIQASGSWKLIVKNMPEMIVSTFDQRAEIWKTIKAELEFESIEEQLTDLIDDMAVGINNQDE